MSDQSAPVTIILPTFNRARYVVPALDSLLKQSRPAAQVIVVNDGSSDETSSVMQSYGARIEFIEKANGGKCSAINAALSHAREKYVWVFDDDDIACPDALARHVAALDAQPDAGFTISGSYRCHNAADGITLDVVRAQPVRPFDDDDHLLELLLSSYIAGPSTMIRRQLIEQVGPYREDLARVDDFEMALRLSLVSRPTRLADSQPSYYRRWHLGLRGWAGQRFDYAQSVGRSRTEERLVMRDMHTQLTLAHYLPRPHWHQPLDSSTERRARLRRWVVMVQKAMWPEAHDELQSLRELGLAKSCMDAVETAWACRAFSDLNTLSEMQMHAGELEALGGALADIRLSGLKHATLRQTVYHLRAALRERDWRRLRLGAFLARRALLPALLGMGGKPTP